MKYTFLMVFILLSLQATAFSCGTDSILSYTRRTETQACTAAAYCRMMDFNIETGLTEEFYGFHPNCAGQQERAIEQWLCQKSDGAHSTYWDNNVSVWGFCQPS